jgi:hypothetical protein
MGEGGGGDGSDYEGSKNGVESATQVRILGAIEIENSKQ